MYVAIRRPRAHHARMCIMNVGKDRQYRPRVNSLNVAHLTKYSQRLSMELSSQEDLIKKYMQTKVDLGKQ